LKYINTNSENTNACKNHTNNSIAKTTNGAINGTLAAYIVAVTTSPKSTTHANIFQNSLRVSESILVNSPTNSRKPINNHNKISKVFIIIHTKKLTNHPIEVIFGIDGLIHTHFNGIYLSIKCNQLLANQ
jgi:hypothetical protein